MSSDVGESVRLVYTGEAGATVTAQVTDPDDVTGVSVTVTEDPDSPGRYVYVFVAAMTGRWRVVFSAEGTVSAVEPYWVTVRGIDRPAPLATAEDVADLWRPLSEAEYTQAVLLVRFASAALRNRCPWIDGQVAAGTLDADLPRLVVVRMVLRVMRNPDMVASKITGPYAVTYAGSDAQNAVGQIRVTDEDVDQLTGGVPNRRGSVGMVTLAPWIRREH